VVLTTLIRTFGFETFGTGTVSWISRFTDSYSPFFLLPAVYGLANTLSGVFGLVQWPLDLLIKLPFDGNYTPVNAALLILGLVTSLSLAARIWLGTK